ncbi:hypothetical protein [Oceanirhabdus sp. W0125-5]|uniref:hypothetical protein n=1 Tax=Oceanirhabdus sp. W0125-5 TaxID=2999116 RepID=UPI0022F2A874|nr:hypothetical protein [Oceanirhabdus sp. W0125-5]WBW96305.1 hypothetical protein OW730_21815 [Oceanirhabdus sp. W0125-5]
MKNYINGDIINVNNVLLSNNIGGKMGSSKIIRNICVSVITIIALLILVISAFVGTIYLAAKGILFCEFMGLQMHEWFIAICGISIFVILLCVFNGIRRKKKECGKLKYILKRKDRITHSIAFILILIIYITQVYMITSGFKEFDSQTILLMYSFTPVPILNGYYNFEKVGISEGGVYYSGDFYKWDKVSEVSFNGNTLNIAVSNKFFRRKDKLEIQFTVKDFISKDVAEFLKEKIGG